MNVYFAMLDDAEAYCDVYGQLMLHAAGFANDDLFARMLSSQAAGEGALPPGLGLSAEEFARLYTRHFPHAGLIGMRGCPDPGAGRDIERQDLVELMLAHRAGADDSETWVAAIVAAGCMGGDHLWQDLGLWSRRDLNQLMRRNFPVLAEKNDRDMKWKKFLYRQICDKEGIPVCPAPSCQACVDYAKCFNTVTA